MALRRVVQAAFLAFVAAVAWIAVRGPQTDGLRLIGADELARHAGRADCWLAIHGGVYDVTAYIPSHPAPEKILTDWCGKEASVAFDTKGRGRPHGAAAKALLEGLRVGTLR
ncbi:MAG: cytochrome b5 domain-containing protein [Elusimicrobia bacterium]|nr:cytochrome b5 domain-containing protein [Elusimicrobiota bacterium]